MKKNVLKAEQEMQEKKHKLDIAQKSHSLVNERIKDLQGKVDKISETEKAIQRKLNDYEE